MDFKGVKAWGNKQTYVSRSRLRAILFVLLLIILYTVGLYIPKRTAPPIPKEISANQKYSSKNSFDKSLKSSSDTQVLASENEEDRINLNTVDSTGLEALPGIGAVLAARIVKYRNKNGAFSSVEELKKVYGLKPEFYEQVAPRLFIDTVTLPPKKNKSDKNNLLLTSRLDLNTADSTALEALPGIGPVLAARIVKYRRKIGAYTDVSELKKVYGLKPEHYDKAAPYLSVNPATAANKNRSHLVDLNTADSVALEALPGIGPVLAGRIVRYRKQYGAFTTLSQLHNIAGMRDEYYEKVTPRLKISSK